MEVSANQTGNDSSVESMTAPPEIISVDSMNTKFLRLTNKDERENFQIFAKNRASAFTYLSLAIILSSMQTIFLIFAIIEARDKSIFIACLSFNGLIRIPVIVYSIGRRIRHLMNFDTVFRPVQFSKLDNFYAFTGMIVIGTALFARVYAGQCHHGEFWSCNPEAKIHAIPQEHVMGLILAPIASTIVFRSLKWEYVCLMFFLAVIALVLCVAFANAYNSIATVVICVIYSVFILYENQKHNLHVFFLTEKLKKTIVDNGAQAAVEHENEMRKMIGNVAHDLKTPLSAFLSGMEEMTHILQACDARCHTEDVTIEYVQEQVHILHAHVLNVKNINSFMTMTINRCIDFTKSSAGKKLAPKHETIDFRVILALPIKIMQDFQSKIAISLEAVPENICSHIITDQQWLQENILALVSNAIKYSDKGAVTVTVSLIQAPPVPSSPSRPQSLVVQGQDALNHMLNHTAAAAGVPLTGNAVSGTGGSNTPNGSPSRPTPSPKRSSFHMARPFRRISSQYSKNAKIFPVGLSQEISGLTQVTSSGKYIPAIAETADTIDAREGGIEAEDYHLPLVCESGTSKTHDFHPITQGALTSPADEEQQQQQQEQQRQQQQQLNQEELRESLLMSSLVAESPPRTKPAPTLHQQQQQDSPTVPAPETPMTALPVINMFGGDYSSTTPPQMIENSITTATPQAVQEGPSAAPASVTPLMLKFEVEDTGIGLSDEAMRNLFNPFNQAQKWAGGTGLGLFSLKQRVDALKGQYGVTKRHDGRQGALFWFTIPYTPDTLAMEGDFSGSECYDLSQKDVLSAREYNDDTGTDGEFGNTPLASPSQAQPRAQANENENNMLNTRDRVTHHVGDSLEYHTLYSPQQQQGQQHQEEPQNVLTMPRVSNINSNSQATTTASTVAAGVGLRGSYENDFCKINEEDDEVSSDRQRSISIQSDLRAQEKLTKQPQQPQAYDLSQRDKILDDEDNKQLYSVPSNGSNSTAEVAMNFDPQQHQQQQQQQQFHSTLQIGIPINNQLGFSGSYDTVDSSSSPAASAALLPHRITPPAATDEHIVLAPPLSQPGTPEITAGTTRSNASSRSPGHKSLRLSGRTIPRDGGTGTGSGNNSGTASPSLHVHGAGQAQTPTSTSIPRGERRDSRRNSTTPSETDSGGIPSLNILLVDDALTIQKMTTSVLKRRGHNVEVADNGAAAVDKVKARAVDPTLPPYDVVLMDLQMPVMDGLEAMRRIRQFEAASTATSAAIGLSEAHPQSTGGFFSHLMSGGGGVFGSTSGTVTPSAITLHSGNTTHQQQHSQQHSQHQSGEATPQKTSRQLIIGLSANPDEETRLDALAAGADEFMSKPFTVDTFVTVYNRLVPNNTNANTNTNTASGAVVTASSVNVNVGVSSAVPPVAEG